jgi:NADPH2:quinone reductase
MSLPHHDQHHHQHHHLADWVHPESMRAVQVHTTGKPDVLQVHHVPLPHLEDGECLVRNSFAGLNYIDTYYRSGLYTRPLPFISGVEGAGIVVETTQTAHDAGVTVGSRVVYFGDKTYAEYTAVKHDNLLHVPDDISLDLATALLIQGFTAHFLVNSTYTLKPGDSCLVHAASGGTGQLVVRLAKLKGAVVFATVSSDEKAQIARNLGADHVFKYDEDYVSQIKNLTQGQGVDVVYDSVGQTTWQKSFEAVKIRGHIAFYGSASGPIPPLQIFHLNQKSLTITAPMLASYMQTREERDWRTREVFDLVRSGELNIVINKVYSLEEAAEGHRFIESRQTTGKVLYKILD